MKQILLFLGFTSAFVLACKKPDNTKNATTIDSDTSQYISWNITGDSFNNEKFLVQNDSLHTIYNVLTADDTEIGFYHNHQNNGYTIVAGIRVEGIVARVYPIDYFSNVLFDLEGLKGYSTILSKSGQITITHFAKNTNEYFSGTFSGEFELESNSSKKFIVKNGKFRIKRMY